jgi:hypothetical protein
MFQHFVLYRNSHDQEIPDEGSFASKPSRHTLLAEEDEDFESPKSNGALVNKTIEKEQM